MKNLLLILALTTPVSACSDDKSSKTAPVVQPLDNNIAVTAPLPTPTPTPTPAATPVPTTQDPGTQTTVKSKTSFSLFKIPAHDASQLRSTAKVISVSIRALKTTSLSALLPSLMTARCGDTVLAQSRVELLAKNHEDEPEYRPSVLIPANALCAGEIAVSLEVFGFEVLLGDVYAADVVSIEKPVEVL